MEIVGIGVQTFWNYQFDVFFLFFCINIWRLVECVSTLPHPGQNIYDLKYWVNELQHRYKKCEAMNGCARWRTCVFLLFDLLSLSLYVSSPGCYCWCPTNSAPAAVGADSSYQGCPFISLLISSVGVAPAERLWSWPWCLYHHWQQQHLGGE